MKRFFLLLGASMFFLQSNAQTGIAVPTMSHCDTNAMNFMSTFNIPGMTFALAKDGKLVYLRAFGNADIAGSEPTQPYHMFRVASVSKPITSIGIMKMMEDGLLSMSDKVFGTGGILENHWYFSTLNISDSRIYDITVQNLLEHNAGWDRNISCFPSPTSPYPWFFGGCDPIAVPLHVTQTLGESNPATEEHLIAYLLEKGLDHDPGTMYAYSNMGYLLLSEIIEEISGMSYEDWMKQNIFYPLGIFDMHIGFNLLSEKMEREGEYVGEGYTTLSLYGDGSFVPWEYGGFNLNAMDGHGGWVATAKDLVRLLVAVDGFSTKPDILSPATITTMTTPAATSSFYAKGWSVNTFDNWWHTGAVDGTASIFVRTGSGYTWAIVLNKRITTSQSNSFWAQLDNLGWGCLSGTSTFPTHDLLESPTMPASNLQAGNISADAMDLSWTNGNGASRIVVAKVLPSSVDNSAFSAYPLDGTDYAANSEFGSGDDLGDGSFVVYNGTGSSASVNGLNPGTDYIFRVYEYTKNVANGNNALYLLGNSAESVQMTSTLGTDDEIMNAFVDILPNPARNAIRINNSSIHTLDKLEITDLKGSMLKNINIQISPDSSEKVDISQFSSGIYLVRIGSENGIAVKKLVIY